MGLLEEAHRVAQAAVLFHPWLGFCGQARIQIKALPSAIYTLNCFPPSLICKI